MNWSVLMIDVFNHILPAEYIAAVEQRVSRRPLMFDRAVKIDSMSNVDARLRVMDQFPGYRQILSLSSPTIETLATGDVGAKLSQIANDAMSKLVERLPERFPGFVASLPLDNPDVAQREAERSIRQLGAVGIQVYTSVHGRPIDQPHLLELLGHVSELGGAVWLHPIRPMSSSDYPSERNSKFDLWWAFGWPHETSVAMGRLVYAGVFDRWPSLKVITHHAGGTIPMFAGRIEHGLASLGTRNPPELAGEVETGLIEPPLKAFKHFYVDTATFGSREALACSRSFFGSNKLLFATDMPFDPEGGAGFIRETLNAIRELNLSADDQSKILEANIKRVLGWNRQ